MNMTRLTLTQFNIGEMYLKPIKSESEYRQALKRLEVIFDAQNGTTESDEADVLALLIEDYEEKSYKIEAPDPIEAIKIRMEQMQLKQADLVNELGGKNRVSEVLNRRRRLTIQMIRKLTSRLNLSPELLIGDYKLNNGVGGYLSED